jgi:hypothetical protein
MQVRIRTLTAIALVAFPFVAALLSQGGVLRRVSKEASAQELPPPDPTDSQVEGGYVGMTKCAACHYAQFKDWKETSHGKAFEILPTKYRDDSSCLECHTTGHGEVSSSEDASSAATTGVSCEACHGPGGAHTRYGLTFVGQGRELTDESLGVLRSKIQRTALDRCLKCHAASGHKPHPKFDRDNAGSMRLDSDSQQASSKSFFQVHRD